MDILKIATLINRHLQKLPLADQKTVVDFVKQSVDKRMDAAEVHALAAKRESEVAGHGL